MTSKGLMCSKAGLLEGGLMVGTILIRQTIDGFTTKCAFGRWEVGEGADQSEGLARKTLLPVAVPPFYSLQLSSSLLF